MTHPPWALLLPDGATASAAATEKAVAKQLLRGGFRHSDCRLKPLAHSESACGSNFSKLHLQLWRPRNACTVPYMYRQSLMHIDCSICSLSEVPCTDVIVHISQRSTSTQSGEPQCSGAGVAAHVHARNAHIIWWALCTQQCAKGRPETFAVGLCEANATKYLATSGRPLQGCFRRPPERPGVRRCGRCGDPTGGAALA